MPSDSSTPPRSSVELGFQIIAAVCIVAAGIFLDGTAGKVVIAIGVLATVTWIVLMVRRERSGSGG